MATTAHTVTVSGQVRAVDRTSITVKRAGRIATLKVRVRGLLHGARAGDSVRILAQPDRTGYWAVRKLKIVRYAPVPTVRITSGPRGLVHTGHATFGFSVAGAVIRFACSLDGSAWFGCRAPAAMPVLGPGVHRFAVLAMNGRHSTVVSRDWTIGNDVPPVAPPTVPVNNSLPVISGTAQSKKVVKTTAGTWAGSPTGYAYKWERCTSATDATTCAAIAGATASSYTCQAADIDSYLRVQVTAINSAGQATALSAATPKTLPS